MNTPTIPGCRRGTVVRSLNVVGAAAILVSAVGCGRKVIVQSPPATVIHTTTPAPAPAPAPALATSTREIVVVRDAPPPPRHETMSSPPSGQHVWIPGYWIASHDGRQEWVPGRWEVPPQMGATWVEPRWERRAEGWVFIPGGWR